MVDLSNIRKHGFINSFRCLVYRIFFSCLRLLFKFERWHSMSNFHCSVYKRSVINELNQFHFHSIVDVGCGLGEIITRLNAARRVGIDASSEVIKAAKFLSNGSVKYFTIDEYFNAEEMPKADLLIMLNFAHCMSLESLIKLIKQYVNKNSAEYLLIDVIKNGSPIYEYHHNRSDLENLGTIQAHILKNDDVRDIYLVRLKT
jgi:SAM-dependent methyltransferase